MIELTLREIRLKLGMTIDEMAEVINVPKSTYSYWENRNKTPEGGMEKVRKLYNDPRLKYMIRINELYYSIVSKKRKALAGSKTTFCQINLLDRNSWKAKTENQVIKWK